MTTMNTLKRLFLSLILTVTILLGSYIGPLSQVLQPAHVPAKPTIHMQNNCPPPPIDCTI
uniref:Uncharacterized protein n=1 Tax=Thermosporothrix sp. COM3 TaxID=2490863 RepID=A0A455STS9_9CHLR|nr:hypothetical protein KTC_58710 [Thermosporothrix sp. COM3]